MTSSRSIQTVDVRVAFFIRHSSQRVASSHARNAEGTVTRRCLSSSDGEVRVR